MLGAEDLVPYERPALSKEYLRGGSSIDDTFVRPALWYADNGIDLRTGTTVVQIEPATREVVLAGGERIGYERLLVATGSRNRRLDVEGSDLPGISDLRTVGDSDEIRAAASSGAKVVCIGMGFIGAEVAASLAEMGCIVTVVEIFETTLFRVLGPELGRVVERLHRDHGVTMHFNDKVERFEGDLRVERVVTSGGLSLEADLVVVGIGTEPAMDVMTGTGLDDPAGIPVGPTLETAIPGVFAAGDVARHEHPVFGPIRVEHFDNAIKMGATAARNMLGGSEVFDDPHWFWSDQYDSQIQMAGFAPTWDRMIVRGSLEEGSFCAFLLDERGVVRSSVSLDYKRDVRRSFGLIRSQIVPDPQALEDPDTDLRSLVPQD